MTKMRKCYGGKRRLNLCFFLCINFGWRREGEPLEEMLGLQQHSVVMGFLQVLLNVLNYILDKALDDFCVNRK